MAEAAAVAPDQAFEVHTSDTSHLAPITRPARLAEILTAARPS